MMLSEWNGENEGDLKVENTFFIRFIFSENEKEREQIHIVHIFPLIFRNLSVPVACFRAMCNTSGHVICNVNIVFSNKRNPEYFFFYFLGCVYFVHWLPLKERALDIQFSFTNHGSINESKTLFRNICTSCY